MEQTSARLRKTFRYPTDDDLPEALDEEEQEQLIHVMHAENAARNKQYTQMFLALPLVSSLLYLPALFAPTTSLLSLLSISSLLSTAYLLFILPPETTAIPFLDALNGRTESSGHGGPILTYLPYLNIGLVVMLSILGLVSKGRDELWFGFGWVPAVVLGMVMLAKVVMASVDPEAELEDLKYGFKGA